MVQNGIEDIISRIRLNIIEDNVNSFNSLADNIFFIGLEVAYLKVKLSLCNDIVIELAKDVNVSNVKFFKEVFYYWFYKIFSWNGT